MISAMSRNEQKREEETGSAPCPCEAHLQRRRRRERHAHWHASRWQRICRLQRGLLALLERTWMWGPLDEHTHTPGPASVPVHRHCC